MAHPLLMEVVLLGGFPKIVTIQFCELLCQ
jgi:hypothetical protein